MTDIKTETKKLEFFRHGIADSTLLENLKISNNFPNVFPWTIKKSYSHRAEQILFGISFDSTIFKTPILVLYTAQLAPPGSSWPGDSGQSHDKSWSNKKFKPEKYDLIHVNFENPVLIHVNRLRKFLNQPKFMQRSNSGTFKLPCNLDASVFLCKDDLHVTAFKKRRYESLFPFVNNFPTRPWMMRQTAAEDALKTLEHGNNPLAQHWKRLGREICCQVRLDIAFNGQQTPLMTRTIRVDVRYLRPDGVIVDFEIDEDAHVSRNREYEIARNQAQLKALRQLVSESTSDSNFTGCRIIRINPDYDDATTPDEYKQVIVDILPHVDRRNLPYLGREATPYGAVTRYHDADVVFIKMPPHCVGEDPEFSYTKI